MVENSSKTKFGIIASIILTILIGVFFLWVSFFSHKLDAHEENNFKKIESSKAIRWGVKADTKLFGLLNTGNSKFEGFDVDIAEAVTQKIAENNHIKLTPKFQQVTSSTRIQLIKNNNIDAFAATTSITKSREKVIDFSDPYFLSGQSIIVPEDSKVNSIEDLNNNKSTIITVVGSNSATEIKKVAPNASINSLQDYSQAMTALKAGQGQALTTDIGILYGLANENKGFKVISKSFTDEPYGIGIDKGQTKFKNEINKALVDIKKDGQYDKIVEKWFKNVPGINWRDLIQ